MKKEITMQQLVLDIRSDKDATLIKELLKKFKSVEVNSFEPSLSAKDINDRIQQGIDDADNGRTKSWKEVEARLRKKIKAHK